MTSASSTPAIATPATSTPNSRPATPLSTPPTAAVSDKPQDDSSKLRLFLGILKKCVTTHPKPSSLQRDSEHDSAQAQTAGWQC